MKYIVILVRLLCIAAFFCIKNVVHNNMAATAISVLALWVFMYSFFITYKYGGKDSVINAIVMYSGVAFLVAGLGAQYGASGIPEGYTKKTTATLTNITQYGDEMFIGTYTYIVDGVEYKVESDTVYQAAILIPKETTVKYNPIKPSECITNTAIVVPYAFIGVGLLLIIVTAIKRFRSLTRQQTG